MVTRQLQVERGTGKVRPSRPSFYRCATVSLADLDCKVGGGKLGRDAEGAESRVTTRGSWHLGGMAPLLPPNTPVSHIFYGSRRNVKRLGTG